MKEEVKVKTGCHKSVKHIGNLEIKQRKNVFESAKGYKPTEGHQKKRPKAKNEWHLTLEDFLEMKF